MAVRGATDACDAAGKSSVVVAKSLWEAGREVIVLVDEYDSCNTECCSDKLYVGYNDLENFVMYVVVCEFNK